MWFIFALTFALTSTFSVIIAKRVMRETSEILYLLLAGLFTLPFLSSIVLIFYKIPSIDNVFLLAVLGSIALDVIAAIAAYRAIKISDVSLVAPISAFNPVFTGLISFIFLKELINERGWLGILLVCVGAYLLQLSKRQKGVLGPIKAFATHKGVQLSLLAYFIWAVTPILQKTAIFHTYPQVPPFVSLSGMIGTITIFGLISSKHKTKLLVTARRFLPLLIIVGILGGIGQASAFIAFSLTNLGFATAIFKLSMIFTVILGWFFFKEINIKDRLLGSLVMLGGVLFLVT